MTAARRMLLVLLATGLFAGGCTLDTLGGPQGGETYTARFDDIQHLVIGHSVRISDLPVGTVTAVDLEGYDAVVEFSLEPGRQLLVGTTASISSTSLLGENYVRLTLPGSDAEPLPGGAEIPSAGADASLEELTVQLLALTRAVQGRDVSAVVEAGATAIGERGPELNGLLRTLDSLGDNIVSQLDAFDLLLTDVAQLGAALGDDTAAIGETLLLAADATGELAAQRETFLQTVEDVTGAAEALNDDVLRPHSDRLTALIDDLTPVVDVLAGETDTVIATLRAVAILNELFPRALAEDRLIGYGIFDRFRVGDVDLNSTELASLLNLLGGA